VYTLWMVFAFQRERQVLPAMKPERCLVTRLCYLSVWLQPLYYHEYDTAHHIVLPLKPNANLLFTQLGGMLL